MRISDRRRIAGAWEGRKTGLTLVETIVVIAIMTVLAGLGTMAISASRATARVTQCQNNLRQVGLATLQFMDANKQIPFHPRRRGFTELLPFLGELPRYEQLLDTTLPVDTIRLLAEPPAVFRCPSDYRNVAAPPGLGDSNYLPCGGRSERGQRPHTRGFTTIAGLNEVVDGLGHTLFYAERLGVHFDFNQDFRETVKRSGIVVSQFSTTEAEFENHCWQNYLTSNQIHLSGYSSTFLDIFTPFATKRTPNTVTCFSVTGRVPPELEHGESLTAPNANSLHVASVNVFFADGAVKSISDDVEPSLWIAWGTVAGRD